jgi:hypothetical protein
MTVAARRGAMKPMTMQILESDADHDAAAGREVVAEDI